MPRKPIDSNTHLRARELRETGATLVGIANYLGISLSSVKKCLKQAGLSGLSAEQAHEKAVESFKAKKLKCRLCGTPIEFSKRESTFCSRSCASSYGNRERYPLRRCIGCDHNTVKHQRKFCDTCLDSGARKVKKLEEANCDSVRKRILIEQRGHQCQECKNTLWLGKPIPLELDHFDGNSDNNEEKNLRLLCPNCHSLTPTYKGKNKGRGIRSKRQVDRIAKLRSNGREDSLVRVT